MTTPTKAKMKKLLTIAWHAIQDLWNVMAHSRATPAVVVALLLIIALAACGSSGGDDSGGIDRDRSLTSEEWCMALAEESPDLVPVGWDTADFVEDCRQAADAGWTRPQLRSVYEDLAG